jgi:hypothetical protein
VPFAKARPDHQRHQRDRGADQLPPPVQLHRREADQPQADQHGSGERPVSTIERKLGSDIRASYAVALTRTSGERFCQAWAATG